MPSCDLWVERLVNKEPLDYTPAAYISRGFNHYPGSERTYRRLAALWHKG